MLLGYAVVLVGATVLLRGQRAATAVVLVLSTSLLLAGVPAQG